MAKRKRRRRRRQRGGVLTMPNASPRAMARRFSGPNLTTPIQRGGVFPLAALLPALVAGSKAAALGALGGAASYGVKKGLKAATTRKKKRH